MLIVVSNSVLVFPEDLLFVFDHMVLRKIALFIFTGWANK